MTKQVITLTPAAYELLTAQIETMPYALAKPLLQLLKSNAEPMSIEIPEPQPEKVKGYENDMSR